VDPEVVEEGIENLVSENKKLKHKMQELLQEVEEFQTEIRQFERKKGGHEVADSLRKELEHLKREKERQSERLSDLALALKEVTDDLRHQKEENERLRGRLAENGAHSSVASAAFRDASNHQHVTNCTSNLSEEHHNAKDRTERKRLQKLNDLVGDYRKENDRFVEKVGKLQKKLAMSGGSSGRHMKM